MGDILRCFEMSKFPIIIVSSQTMFMTFFNQHLLLKMKMYNLFSEIDKMAYQSNVIAYNYE